MTTTERLQKHIDELDERKTTLFFDMQNTAATVNSRMYAFHIIIIFASLFVFFIGYTATDKNTFLINWSNIVAILAIMISILQYLSILDRISGRLYKNICDIYKKYDDEFYILKKFNIGEVKENLIKQFYINKTKEISRYECHIAQPNWFSWISISLLITALTLLLLA
jgi:hypothetical protein